MRPAFAASFENIRAAASPAAGFGVSVAADGDQVRLVWREIGGPVAFTGLAEFGSRLERSVMVALNATIKRDWRLTGLVATITMPKRILIA